MNSVLQFDRITKVYKSFWRGNSVAALRDFSLQVEPGEIFGFLGPNGAGKSTAIHLAMGFMRPTDGYGLMLGRPFGHPRTRRRVGFLAEHVAFYHRRAASVIRFYGEINGMRDPLLRERTREMLRLLELEDYADRNIGKFSRGMLQRVGLAQALVNDPELLVLDEPTSALDPLGRVSVREILLAAKNRGKTIFLSSHMLSEIELICDRVAILSHGSLVRLGRTSDLLESRSQTEIISSCVPDEFLHAAEALEDGFRWIVPTVDMRAAIERIWAAGGEIIRVNPVRRSLEEIFVELTSPAENGSTTASMAADSRGEPR